MSVQLSTVLLDKGVVRRFYEAQVRQANGVVLTSSQREALDAFTRLETDQSRIYITKESANVLALRPPRYTRHLLGTTSSLQKARYLRRWARRLRGFNFSREDAVVLAYCSFGVNAHRQLPGIAALITTDGKLCNNFDEERAKIQNRFERMIFNLPAPYTNLRLPAVLTPPALLALT